VTAQKRRVSIAAAVVIATAALVVVAGPGLARAFQARLVSMVAHGISGSVTYKIVDEGRSVKQTTTGVVGKGTISGKLSLDGTLAATLLGAVKGVPIASIARGGSYVVRFDVDARGNHNGLLVIRFVAAGVGTLCVGFTTAYGRFVPGKTDYVPATGTFDTLGGEGTIAKVHASGKYTQGEVTGNTIEKILASASVASLTSGSATPMNSACAAVARLG